jgi:hypothetical protein
MPLLELWIAAEFSAKRVGANAVGKRPHPQQYAPQVLSDVRVKIELPPDWFVLATPSVTKGWWLLDA